MASWTNPKTWIAAILPVSDMNTYVRDNTQYLKDDLDSVSNRIIDIDTSDTTVSNTTAETTIFTVTVSGNTLDTNDMLRFSHWARVENSTDEDTNVTIRVKFGTTISMTSITTTVNGANDIGFIWGDIKSDGSTSAQKGYGLSIYRLGIEDRLYDTGTENVTGNVTFSVTVQWASANAGLVYRHLSTDLQHVIVP